MQCWTSKTTLASVVGITLIYGAGPLKGEVIRYVDPATCSPGNTGTNWEEDAYCYLQDALTEARSTGTVDEIWVSGSDGGQVYRPDDGVGYTEWNWTHSFQMVDDVEIYGGFYGGENYRAQCSGGSSPPETSCFHASDCDDGGSCVDTRVFGHCTSAPTKPCSLQTDCGTEEGFCQYLTVLSGDLMENDAPNFVNYGDNSKNVVTVPAGTDRDTTVLDGFTITGGYASGYVGHPYEPGGGGIRFVGGSAQIRNCAVRRNKANNGGGGIYSYGALKAWIVNSVISENWAGHGGGIGAKVAPQPLIYNSKIVDNFSQESGGGLYLDGGDNPGSPEVVNTLIARNEMVLGSLFGAGIFGTTGENNPGGYELDITNSTVVHNDAGGKGGGLSTEEEASVDIDNSIFWGNTAADGAQIHTTAAAGSITVEYSDVRNVPADDDIYGNVTFGDGCIGTDPVAHDPDFVDPTTLPYDYSLQDTSPCVESGNDALVSEDKVDLDQDAILDEATPYDLAGSARTLGTVDMGAYEAILPILIESNPAPDGTLWRSQKNIMRLTFSDDITLPDAGHVTIKKLLPEGAFGPDLSGSSNFAFEVENDEGNPRILRIWENGSTLVHRTWYAIQNEGDWEGVATFERHLLVQVGDCDGNGIVISLDVGCVNASIPCFVDCGDDRRQDMDGDERIISLDVGIVNGHIGSFGVDKPSGH